MDIAIFGANGRTGRILTQRALAAGHAVTALTRHPEGFPLRDARLAVRQGDAFDAVSIDTVIAGKDAVLSVLGVPYGRRPITLYSEGTANIVDAMNRHAVRRLVCVSSTAVDHRYDNQGGVFFERVLKPVIAGTIGRTTYADQRRMEALVQASDLDWTIVRPSGLFETPDVTEYEMTDGYTTGRFTSRVDVLQRQAKRPSLSRLDRLLLVFLASRVPPWKQTLLLIQPETLLRWHRQGLRLVWKAKSTAPSAKPRISEETRRLIRTMAVENRLWGAERIRGELLKLGIRVSKRTVQKYMHRARPPQKQSQSWATFLHNHAHEIWACDFLQITDLWFRSLFAFFMIELGSRTVMHVGVTRHPTDEWVAQQLREATPFGQKPRYLVRDNDSKYGPQFARVAATSGIEVLRTPVLAPQANPIWERFLGSVRRECLDHVLVFHERHLGWVLREYVAYFNQARPHQGIRQAIPAASETPADSSQSTTTIVSLPILGGLHHDYRCAA